jgi:hypothetical protein
MTFGIGIRVCDPRCFMDVSFGVEKKIGGRGGGRKKVTIKESIKESFLETF